MVGLVSGVFVYVSFHVASLIGITSDPGLALLLVCPVYLRMHLL